MRVEIEDVEVLSEGGLVIRDSLSPWGRSDCLRGPHTGRTTRRLGVQVRARDDPGGTDSREEALMAVRVQERKSWLCYRVYLNGLESREPTGLRVTQANRQKLERLARMMSELMADGKFEYLQHFPDGNLAEHFRPAPPAPRCTGQYEFDIALSRADAVEEVGLALEGADALELEADGGLAVRAGHQLLRLRQPVCYQQSSGRRLSVACRYQPSDAGLVRFALGPHDRTSPLVIDPVLSFSTYLGSVGEDRAEGIAVDAAGNVYVTGVIGVGNVSWYTVGDAFVAKLTPGGESLEYFTLLGGYRLDEARGIAVDEAGNAYIAGHTDSPDFPTTPGAMQEGCGPLPSAEFVSKLATDGSHLVYSTYVCDLYRFSTSPDGLQAIALNPSGAATIAGSVDSDLLPVTPGAFQPTRRGLQDAFVARLDPSGSHFEYATYLGGDGDERAFTLALAADGSAVVGGSVVNGAFPTTPGTIQPGCELVPPAFFDCGENGFVAKIDPTGTRLEWATHLGGVTGFDLVLGIALDSDDFVYATGLTKSSDFPKRHSILPEPPAEWTRTTGDAFVTKITPDGTELVYSTLLGGTSFEQAWAIAVDAAGRAWVTGMTASADFPFVQPLQLEAPTNEDVLVAALTPEGDAVSFATPLGGFTYEQGRAIAVGPNGHIYVAGWAMSHDFPTASPLQLANCCIDRGFASMDAFVAGVITDAPPADLALAYMQVDPPSLRLNEPVIRYTMLARNLGPAAAERVTVTNLVPDDRCTPAMTAVASQGSCRTEAAVAACELGSLAAGATATVEVTVRTTGDPPCGLSTETTNRARINSGTADDPDRRNNTIEVFRGAVCRGGADAALCDEQSPCTVVSCTAGTCHRGPRRCDDDDPCNGAETCDPQFGCRRGTTPSCDDADTCTADGCDAKQGCSHQQVASPGTTGGAACRTANLVGRLRGGGARLCGSRCMRGLRKRARHLKKMVDRMENAGPPRCRRLAPRVRRGAEQLAGRVERLAPPSSEVGREAVLLRAWTSQLGETSCAAEDRRPTHPLAEGRRDEEGTSENGALNEDAARQRS